MDIQYAYTILYVENVPETIAFYVNAFGFKQKFITPEEDYGEIASGSTTLAFGNMELAESNFTHGFVRSSPGTSPFGFELAFTTSDVNYAMESACQHGATVLETAVTKPWGQVVGYLRDPNGFILEVCTPMS